MHLTTMTFTTLDYLILTEPEKGNKTFQALNFKLLQTTLALSLLP